MSDHSTGRSSNIIKVHPEIENASPKQKKKNALARFLEHRWVRLFVYSFTTLTTSCIYYGWQQYSMMLFDAGAYNWRCEPGYNYAENGPCTDQDKAVQTLYSIGAAAEYSNAFVAGILLDHVGPCWCGLVGEILLAIGTILLSFSNQSFQAYIPGILFQGAAVNIIAFPSFILADLFPSRSSLVTALVLSTQTGCTAVTPILMAMWNANPDWTYKGIWLVYLGVIWLPATVLYFFTLPARRFPKVDTPAAAAAAPALAASTDLSKRSSSLKLPELSPKVAPTTKEVWHAFGRELMTIEMLMMCIYYVLQLLQNLYYPTTILDKHGEAISNYVGWMMPTEILWGLIFGFAADYIKTPPLMAVINVFLFFVYILAACESTGLQYFTGFLFVLANSFIFTTKYTYVAETFSPANFGKLAGFIGLVGGIWTLFNILPTQSTNYDLLYYIYAAASVPIMGIIAFLWIRQRKGITKRFLEQVPEKEVQNDVESPTAAVADPTTRATTDPSTELFS